MNVHSIAAYRWGVATLLRSLESGRKCDHVDCEELATSVVYGESISRAFMPAWSNVHCDDHGLDVIALMDHQHRYVVAIGSLPVVS